MPLSQAVEGYDIFNKMQVCSNKYPVSLLNILKNPLKRFKKLSSSRITTRKSYQVPNRTKT